MQQVRFFYVRDSIRLRAQNSVRTVPAFGIATVVGDVAVDETAMASMPGIIDTSSYDYVRLYPDIETLFDEATPARFIPEPIRVLEASSGVIETLSLLARTAPHALFRFLITYCLALDRAYFSALVRHAMSADVRFVEFVEANCLKQWSVERYAQEFDMPVRKFNLLFREMFGMSAKRWLVEKRLSRARDMLVSTPARVLDIALECGFGSHAHFTDSFRKRFLCNPTQFRLHASGKLALACGNRTG